MMSFCLWTVHIFLLVHFDLEVKLFGSVLHISCLLGWFHCLSLQLCCPEGKWGPDSHLWSHPRRCPSLCASSQVSASGSPQCVYLKIEGRMKWSNDWNQTVDHIQTLYKICSHTINCVDNLMSSLLSGTSWVSLSMLISLVT